MHDLIDASLRLLNELFVVGFMGYIVKRTVWDYLFRRLQSEGSHFAAIWRHYLEGHLSTDVTDCHQGRCGRVFQAG